MVALGSTVAEGGKGQGRRPFLQSFAIADIPALISASLKAQQANLILWLPMFLIAGNWIYFQRASEPSIFLTACITALAIFLIVMKQRSVALFLAGMVLLGFCTAKFRTEMVATPMLRGATNGVIIGGYVADASKKSRSARQLTIAVEETTGIPEGEQPKRIRVYSEKAGSLQIGDYITFEAYLSPMPRPIEPGGFDFARMLYFKSIGATGRVIGEPVAEARAVPANLLLRRFFRTLRSTISDRITKVIPGPLGHLADSMVSGERSGIPDDMNTSLQTSGLAHIISISGLHMAMVAGGVFWAARALLALIPGIALIYPIKKIAAVAALGVGLFYTLLADSGSATERSFLMIAVMFFAILVDRPALSLRNLAIAALLILVVTPEESVGASFQMSFLAVMGMAALFQWWHQREREAFQPKRGVFARWFETRKRFVVLSSLTTLVAGTASTIAAVYHFDRLAPYSLLANGLAMPITEALVMPPAIVAVLLMPLGLEYYPLKLMELGLSFTMQISDWIAAMPGASVLVAKPNISGIVLIALAAGVLAAGVGKFRLLALPLAAIGVLVVQSIHRPTLLIENRAANVAVMNSAGEYVLANDKNKFAGSKWLQANGETTSTADAAQRKGWDCDTGDCFTELAPLSVSYLHQKSGEDVYCPPTEIIIADFPLNRQCRDTKLVIDRIDVWRNGAYAVYFDGLLFEVKSAREEQGDRPWTYDSRKSIKG